MEQAGKGADSDALVFVYGSLKRGMANHGQLGGARWLGQARLRGLALYDLGPFPMAVASNAVDAWVHGEVHEVDATQLAALDRFEGAPRLYERERWRLEDGRAVWVYVGRQRQVRHVQRIRSGLWRGPAPGFRRSAPPPASDRPRPPAPPGQPH